VFTRLASGVWRLAAGVWRLAAGGWRLAVGGWRLAAGGWRLIFTTFAWWMALLEKSRLRCSAGARNKSWLSENLSFFWGKICSIYNYIDQSM
jgi:hypothetical protein